MIKPIPGPEPDFADSWCGIHSNVRIRSVPVNEARQQQRDGFAEKKKTAAEIRSGDPSSPPNQRPCSLCASQK
jgi:hypothetical protein